MLSEYQITILRALIDTIIPPDDYPGGWDGGVGEYLFHQFEHDLAGIVGIYQEGLLALDAEASHSMGHSFPELSPTAQAELLAKIEHGQVQTVWTLDPASFLATVVSHCAEGFYSDTDNAGNRGNVAWTMVGFEVSG